MAALDYEGNRKYFKRNGVALGCALVTAAVAMMFVAASITSGVSWLVLIAALLGSLVLAAERKNRPKDSAIDLQAALAMAELEEQGLEKFGLHAEDVRVIKPLVLSGYSFTEQQLDSLVDPPVIRGDDGVFRCPNIEGLVIFFGEDQLHAYKRRGSLTDPSRLLEQTDEYFYRDVVSVATESAEAKLAVGPVKYDAFRMTTSGGTSIASAMSDPLGSAEPLIQEARQLIRSKKTQG